VIRVPPDATPAEIQAALQEVDRRIGAEGAGFLRGVPAETAPKLQAVDLMFFRDSEGRLALARVAKDEGGGP
jgi:hypothetical protein